MTYRTKTYIAGDWTGDKDAIDQLYKWKNSNYWSLTFTDAHDLTQSSDTSLYCSIKRSLCDRLNASKTFILIVGDSTTAVTKGNCVNCRNYVSPNLGGPKCCHGIGISMKSYIEYECDKAIRDGLSIIVLYNKTYKAKSLCPECLKDCGTHVAMKKTNIYGNVEWDYESVRKAIMGY
jgi:hypothetical protein